MLSTGEVLAFIRENDVKFVRLSFCDLLGVRKDMAIMADELDGRLGRASPSLPLSWVFAPQLVWSVSGMS